MSDAIERVARAISESDARQRFELWLNSKFFALDGGLNEWTGQFEYVYPHIQSMWVAWQGAIESLRPELEDAEGLVEQQAREAAEARLAALREALTTIKAIVSDRFLHKHEKLEVIESRCDISLCNDALAKSGES